MTEGMEVPLSGAGLQDRGLARVGDTVRRPVGEWTTSVDHLLRSLRANGFDPAPEPLGIDAAGREMLRYIEGRDPGWPLLPEISSTDGAERLGCLTARLRAALAAYECPGDARWQFACGAPGPGMAMEHGDLGPWNLLWGAGSDVVGVIDWDFAGPGDEWYDTGYLAWFTVPMMDDEGAYARGFSEPPDRLARLRAFAAGAGISEAKLVHVVIGAQEESARRIVERGSAYGGVWKALYELGRHESAAADRVWTTRHFSGLQ